MYENLKKDFETQMFAMIDEGPKIMKWKVNHEE